MLKQMCSEYSITAEQISQRSDKRSLKVMVTNADCPSGAKSEYTRLKGTFVSSIVLYSSKCLQC